MNGESQASGGSEDRPSIPALVCVAASSGGVGAMPVILDRLSPDLPLAIVLVQHLSPDHQSRLPEILSWHTSMQVRAAADGDRIEHGVIYVAPPDSHVLVTAENALELTHTAKVEHVRPSADLLLSSAARHYEGLVIGVILTGTGFDGRAGVMELHQAGGVVIAQDPETTEFRSMPEAAIATGGVSYVLSLEEIPHTITRILESGAGK